MDKILILFFVFIWTTNFAFAANCGYDSCNPVKDGMINVHVVPHTHDDVGWLKTVDQYYYGSKSDIQTAGVQYILDSVIAELLKDKNKRFIYVEVAFFSRWWKEQTDPVRHIVKGLVKNGQLEFILGGWCMNDEASTHYNAIIDQHTLGFEFLRQNFGDCGRPRVAWQIDPFGHSREQASLFAQMGFDGLFFGRLDYQDKNQRIQNRTMEMVWKGSPKNLGGAADLFTGALYNGYGPPPGFCFDAYCMDDPIMDDDRLEDYNLEEKMGKFLNYTREQARAYATDHLIMTMGSDFNYQNANKWFKNLDKLIKHVNKHANDSGMGVNLLYSTPSCYLYQLNKANRTWTTKEDDFFPYAHRDHAFWTGYFTSRPAIKGYVRQSNNFLQVCKQMDALAQLEDSDNSTWNILQMKKAMGVAQHHDAVSGTEKQAVTYDYARRLAAGTYECQKVVNDAYMKLLPIGSTEKPPGQVFCNLLNISSCHLTEHNKQFSVIVYNPLARSVSSWVRIPIIGKAFTVTGPDGKSVPAQIVTVTRATKKIPERTGSLATCELVFKVQLPPLGFSVYFARKNNKIRTLLKQYSRKRKTRTKNGKFVLKNEHVSLTFINNKLTQMKNLDKNIEIGLQQSYMYYSGFEGDNYKGVNQSSGAYIFRPTSQKPSGFNSRKYLHKSFTQKGVLVQELHQTISPWITQVVRLYQGEKYAEFEWTVGPIPIKNNIGKEVISRFESTLDSRGTFYTDANGREMLERQRNYRATWTLNQTEPVAGNYYPVNSRIFIRDEEANIQLTVLTDRSQGGSSILDGSVELMVHRRLLHDDALGVGEALNETGSDGKGLIVRGKHFVHLDFIDTSASFHRDMALRLYMAPSLSFSSTSMKWRDWKKKFHTNWSGMKRSLPPNVHLLTLEQWGGPGVHPTFHQPFLLRLEHFYEKDDDAVLSKPVNVSLSNLFQPFDIQNVTELTLGANAFKSNVTRLHWNTDILEDDSTDESGEVEVRDNTILLNPMQIKTFQVKLKVGDANI